MALAKRNAETLARSLRTALAPSGTLRDKLSAAELHVAYGLADQADRAIEAARAAMQAQGVTPAAPAARLIERLDTINRRFREAQLAAKVNALGTFGARLLDNKEEVVLSVARRSRTLLVVFSTMHNNFWVSCPVLHCLLPTGTVSVLYLKDPREMMYLCGLQTYGATFAALADGIRSVARELAINDIRVAAFSSGGYAALLMASLLEANAYLGFSVRTDLSPTSPLPTDRYVMRKALRDAAAAHLIDLKPMLRERASPKRGILYYGNLARIDVAHARHLADLPDFIVKEVPNTWHNTIVTLLADGTFEGILRRFLR